MYNRPKYPRQHVLTNISSGAFFKSPHENIQTKTYKWRLARVREDDFFFQLMINNFDFDIKHKGAAAGCNFVIDSYTYTVFTRNDEIRNSKIYNKCRQQIHNIFQLIVHPIKISQYFLCIKSQKYLKRLSMCLDRRNISDWLSWTITYKVESSNNMI